MGSYEALLADPGVDAIYICLPNALHHRWTMAALAAGKHVLCEKPYTRRPDEVTEAFDAADAAGLVLMEAFMWRHTPPARRFVELLPTIGELQQIRSTFSFSLDDGADIRLSSELEGGSLMDVGTYCVNAARLLAAANPSRPLGAPLSGRAVSTPDSRASCDSRGASRPSSPPASRAITGAWRPSALTAGSWRQIRGAAR